MNISQAIQRIYPEADPMKDYRVEDDGSGAKIKIWNIKDASGSIVPRPTQKELDSAYKDFKSEENIKKEKETAKKGIDKVAIQAIHEMINGSVTPETKNSFNNLYNKL